MPGRPWQCVGRGLGAFQDAPRSRGFLVSSMYVFCCETLFFEGEAGASLPFFEGGSG